jgi:hypothetical protein
LNMAVGSAYIVLGSSNTVVGPRNKAIGSIQVAVGSSNMVVNVKQPHYRPGQVQRVPEG